ncbi:MAG: metal-dependent hydrolase [Thalassovita sp.]|nr:metal-dependent hydrolase [Thalassovita sp.]
MKITWLGHAGFRIEIEDQVLLVDPWLTGNPMFPEESRAAAIEAATAILVSHGHGDHSADALAIGKELDIPILGIYDLMSFWETKHGANVTGFNKGGTVRLGDVAVTMVNAVHSSSMPGEVGPVYAGAEAGYMIAGEGHTIYFTGDTDVMADMKVFNDLHAPDIGILCAGGHFTMDMKRAGYAAKTFFDFKTVIPCHYRTFPLLEQSAEALVEALPGVDVVEPQVMVPITV